uniref:G domain-containing protein n=1 Tax=Plectus sambesii TaxID=2011161 RepID=A0A914XNS0_9BILA
MHNVHVKVCVTPTAQQKSAVLKIPTDTNADDLIAAALDKFGWSLNNYTVQDLQRFDKDLNDYIDIEEPYSNILVENLQKFQIVLIQLPLQSDGRFAVNLSRSGSFTDPTSVYIPATKSVSDLISMAIKEAGWDQHDLSVIAIKYYAKEFEEYADLDQPYPELDVAIFSDTYSIEFSEAKEQHVQSPVNVQPLSKNEPPPEPPQQPQPPPSPVSNGNGLQEIAPSKEMIWSPIGTGLPGSGQDGSTIYRQALGRIAHIGELYDARTDTFCGRGLFVSKLPTDSITKTDTPRTVTDFVLTDSINDKFNKLDVQAELKVSMLCGLVNASGHGKYLSSTKSSNKESSATLVCRMTTVHEAMEINSVLKLISADAITNTPNATHVVIGIQWGAMATATVSCAMKENEDQKQLEGELKIKLQCIKAAAAGAGNYQDETSTRSRDFHLEFFVDALPNGDDLPTTVEQAILFMKRIPTLIANANDGRGTPISYTLFPLSPLQNVIASIAHADRLIRRVEDCAIDDIVRVFDEMEKTLCQLNDWCTDFNNHTYCIADDDINNIRERLQLVRQKLTAIRTDLHDTIINIRYGRTDTKAIYQIIQAYDSSLATRGAVNQFLDTLQGLKEKIAYAEYLIQHQTHYVGKGDSFTAKRTSAGCGECYVFFCDYQDSDNLAKNRDYFGMLVKDKELPCYFVDAEVCPGIAAREGVPAKNRICHFSNESYINIDLLADYIEEQSKCVMKCRNGFDFSTKKPNKRIDLELRCPQSVNGKKCDKIDREWSCVDCRQPVQYGFDQKFYCDCGSAPITAFAFRCNDKNHGGLFSSFPDGQIELLVKEIRPSKEVNILILGETGVGKSTWINGFANYLTFKTLDEAQQSAQVCLIPSQFSISDSNYKQKTIQVGESKNESNEVGASCTQEPLAHVFSIGKKLIRLIDTPGIGDTRGSEQDNKNFAAILRYISHFKEIHGICILLKPNNAKLNLVFKYCINELLTHLHKTAAVNIAFCFTNARSTFYRPGDTLPPLTKFLENLQKNQSVEISLGKETVYCMDNEAFRFLCCLHAGENFSGEECKNYAESWNVSERETQRLLEHFEQLPPHEVGNTISLNEARHLILTLTKPLADISSNIQLNIQAIAAEKEKVEKLDSKDAQLAKNLQIPHIALKPVPLGHPRTVCTDAKCTNTKPIPNTTARQVEYKTICHDHCYLDNVTPEQVPNPSLQKCNAFGSNLKCKMCGCSWDLHMHITFSQESVTEMIEDEEVKKAINENKGAKTAQNLHIEKLKKRGEEYKAEQKKIDEICAKFGAFLKRHAILPYNDAIEDYLKLNISEAERLDPLSPNKDDIKRLKDQLKQYQEQKRVLDESMRQDPRKEVKLEDIKVMQKELLNLPLTGKDIQDLFDATVTGQQTNFRYTEQYYDQTQYRPKKKYPVPVTYQQIVYNDTQDHKGKSRLQKVLGFVGWN